MGTTIFNRNSGEAGLVVLEQGTVRAYRLGDRLRWTLGRRTPESVPDIALDSVIVSREQGEFFCDRGQWYFCDVGSKNGTYHNNMKVWRGYHVRSWDVPLRGGDVLKIDQWDAARSDPRGVWMYFSDAPIQGVWRYYPLQGRQRTVIGREAGLCDIVQPLSYVSARHARIEAHDGRYWLSDCGSKAGTWLNGRQVAGETALCEKDQISICDCQFIFVSGGLVYNDRLQQDPYYAAGPGSVMLRADIRSKKVSNQNGHGEKELIRDVALEIRSGELIALLGSSGAGKSTLMNCLNGTERSGVEGTVRLCGEDLYSNYERLKVLVGNVPQQNVLNETLSVEQELKYAAKLRLPGDTSQKDIQKHVDKTLEVLNLQAKRKTPIRKLSGGEQKRVNIGVELVADKELLCLDEPDAGLDPHAKRELFSTLRDLAHDKGKCVLAIIHDVSEIDMFDQIVMMVKVNDVGRLAFCGSPAEGRKRFGVKDLTEIYDIVMQNPGEYITEN